MGQRSPRKRRSNEDMAYEVLVAAGEPLHIGDIVKRIRELFGARMTRESLASAILRKAKQGERFVKVGANTYGIAGRDCP
jgi:DNA-directed RNA polymerase delta subunit